MRIKNEIKVASRRSRRDRMTTHTEQSYKTHICIIYEHMW